MDPAVISAIIAASIAFITSILSLIASYFNNRRQQLSARKLEMLKANIQSERDEDAARRSYIFEGKKRMYEEYEPIRFQLAEAVIHAAWRVQSIARSARRNDIKTNGDGWLSSANDYYLMVLIYDLMLPAAWFRIMKKKLTFIDFSLDSRIEWEYILAKSYYLSFTDDFLLAKIPGAELEYDPNHKDWQNLRKTNPSVYWRQGGNFPISPGRQQVIP